MSHLPFDVPRSGFFVTVVVTCVFGVAPGGCVGDGAADPPAGVTVRDSAGVRWVEYGAEAALDEVRLEAPVLTVGREGDPDCELFRANGVLGLASGNVVVANGGTRELRFYGSDGAFVRTVGGSGEGPGEFGFISSVQVVAADSLVVIDPRMRRLSWFDSAGTFAREQSYAADLRGDMPGDATSCVAPSVTGLLQDGSRFGWGWSCLRLEGSDGWRSYRGTLEILRDGAADTLGVFPLLEIWERADGASPMERAVQSPFSRRVAWAVHDDRAYLARMDRRRVDVFGLDGSLTQVVADVSAPEPVTGAHRDAERAVREAGPGAAGPGGPAQRPVAPYPDHLPPHGGLLVTHEGELWLQDFVAPGDALQRWTAHAPDGVPLRRVALEADVDVQSVRGGRLYGLQQDDLGIQTVVVFELPEG